MNADTYKCVKETLDHREAVAKFINTTTDLLNYRATFHDESKLHDPELEIFVEYSPKLKNITYGSDEYKACLKEMQTALDHHYQFNSHHPEHYETGIKGMNLLDLVEMICDWKAATMRHADGDIYKSIEINQQRFGYSDELKQIFLNTVRLFNQKQDHE